MRQLLILSTALWFTVSAPVLAQTVPGAAGSSNTPTSAVTSGGTIGTNPLFSLHDMPCSVSLNAIGGIQTSASCGTDPLAVPTQTLTSQVQVNGSAPPSSSSSGAAAAGGTQSSQFSGGTGGSTTQNASNTPSAGSVGGAASGTATLCASSVPTTGGPSGAGSLIGGC